MPDSASIELAQAIKLSKDTLFIVELLKNHPDYTIQGEFGLNALEAAYYWENDVAYACLLNYVLAQKDTLFVKRSKVLPMAISQGDTSTMRALFSIVKGKVTNEDMPDYIWSFANFLIRYNQDNKFRSKYGDESYRFHNFFNYDLSVARILMHLGVDFSTPDSRGRNILFFCYYYPVYAKFFIENCPNIDLNRLDVENKTFLQYYIDDLVEPIKLPYSELQNNEKEDGYYANRLEMLKYYIQKGAKVGPDKEDGWEYFVRRLKSSENLFLKDLVKKM